VITPTTHKVGYVSCSDGVVIMTKMN